MNFDLIDKLSREPEPFYAPVPDAERVFVNVLQGDVPYRFEVERPRPGWWLLRPRGTKAIITGEQAPTNEIAGYLEALPRFHMFALFPSGESRWEAMQFNSNIVTTVHLVRHNIVPMSVIRVRAIGGVRIYDHVKILSGGPYIPPNVVSIVQDYERRITEAERLERERIEAEERRKRTKNSVVSLTPEEQLRLAGARLISMSGQTVSWEHQGNTYTMQVSRTGQIEVAGVCLDGTDKTHNLTSIVGVMRRHRELGRTY